MNAGSIVFSNLQSPICNGCGEIVVGSATFTGFDLSEAQAFTPSGNYILTDAQIAVSAVDGAGAPALFDVFLYTSSGGPGLPIEQIGFGLTAGAGNIVTANTVGTPIILLSGTQYYVVLAPNNATTFVDWAPGGSSSTLRYFTDSTGNFTASGSTDAQFQIDGITVTAAPEPSTLLMLGLPLMIGLGATKFGRRE